MAFTGCFHYLLGFCKLSQRLNINLLMNDE